MVAVFGEIFSALNHQPGDKLDLPLSVMKLSDDGQSYIVSGSGKQGALWFSGYHGTLQGAVDTMILAARLKRGDMDVELPECQFRIKGIGIRHSEPTGRYTVGYLGGRNGFDYKEKTFDDEQSASEFAKAKEGVVKPEVRYLNEYDGYRVSVTNPLTGKSHEIGETFGTRADASAWLDEMHDEANSRALEAIGTEMGQKRGGREHFYISSTWSTRRKGMLFSVMEDRKDIPWPVIKDFDSRAEAESWLKENKERLEALRKERKERERNIVYFNNDESRVGKDWRQGRDADAEMFTEAFGFRGVQFGNWTNDRDRQEALNQAYDSLMDMAAFLGLSPRALSLDGELGLAFGARGSGSALAHYEPGEVVINLTKTRGAGSLGHEWFHALDNFMSRSNGVALGMTTKGHGLDGMNPSVRAAFESLVKVIVNSEYGKRSRARGEYWGREEEMAARLFETWVNSELSKKGEHSPFLVGGLKIDSIRKFQLWNYLEYEMQESVKADREGREPQLMSKEEFNELPESLKGYPYPTERELGEFAPLLETLFNALSSRESEAGSLAGEASAGYHVNDRNGRYPRKGQTAAGMSLFDWADRNERSHRDADARDEELIASEETNASIDGFVEDYRDYLDRSEALEREISELTEGSEERVEAEELLDHEEVRIIEARGMLHERLRDFYVRNNTPEDAERIARDMLARVMAEVEVRRNRAQILRDILDGGTDAGVETPEHDQILTRQEERGELEASGQELEESAASQGEEAAAPEQTQGSVRTAGGGIRYEAVGHLPDAQAGEFAYVERQFSRSGEFLFTGADKIRDRGDVAYLFRSLENYSIEHVFAVLVKDGRAKVVHIGMGGPTASYAYLGAVRAAYDAFGADKIYLVHNHPSGNLIASPQDQKLMASIEKAFGGKADSEGVIMDTTSGRYSTFHGSGRAEEHVRPQTGEESDAEVLRFDRQNSGTEVAELSKIKSSRDVSEFLTSLRLGDRSKVSYLVLSNSNHIIGNFHTDYSDMSGGLAEEIASTAVKYGGNRVVVYGNVPLTRSQMLKDNVKALSLDGVQVLDVMDMTDGIHRSAMDEGMMREPDSDYSSVSRTEAEGDVRFRLGSSAASFDERLNRAVAEKGTVMPGLNDAEVTVVDVPRHEYEGDRILSQAVDAAAQRYAGRVLHYNNHGAEFDYEIKPQSLKYAANHAQKSENIGVHAAVMNHLDAVIQESIEVMEHADVHKTSGKRSEENGYNPDSLMHRFVGAVNISGQTYRVISTLKEYAGDKLNRHHTYEVIKIEVLDAETPSTSNGTTTRDESQVEVAKILKDCEIHNKSGEKILRESALADSGVEPEGMEREGSGEISDDDLSFHNDPWSRAWGESIRTAKKRKEYAARYRGYMRARVRELAKILHLDNVELLEDGSSLSGNKASAKGFFSTRDGKIIVILSNNISTEDIEQTLLHEAVAHYGLRKLFGEHFSVFLRNVYANAEADVRQRINALMAKNGWDVDLATEEYLASLAERIDFEHDSVFSEWWRKVKSLFIDMLHKIGLKDFTGVTLSDNELRYILWSSYQNLKDPGSREPIFGAARDVAMQDSLKVGNYAEHETLTDDAAADAKALYDVNERFNERLETQINGTLPSGYVYKMGRPGMILRSTGIADLPIELRAQRLIDKATKFGHDFQLSEVKDLPMALQNPVAVFAYGDASKAQNIVLQLRSNNKNFIVGLSINPTVGGKKLEINSIRNVFPKDNVEWVKWITDGKLLYVDKEKIQPILSQLQTIPADVARIGLDLDDAAKIVENFENPKTDAHNDNNLKDTVSDAMALYDVNERFNEHLEKLGSGEVRNGELNLGQPGAILRSAGIDGVRISLQWNVLQKKMNPSYVHNHPFTIEDVKNLPLAINNPIAIFESKGHGDFNILVNLEKDGKNFVVSLEAKRKSVRGGEIVVDDIVTLYPKEVKGIINWINTGLGKVYDKEKTLEWLRTCETHNRHSAIQELDDAAKIVENFENPKTDAHNDNNSEDEGVLLRPGAPSYSPRDRAIARDAYNSICASGGYQFREAMQDSMLGLKTLYQSILGKDTRIEDVAGFENAYLFENRVSSMNATHQYAYFHIYMKPLLDAIYDITGKSDEERRILTDYLMAKHGLERNAHMRAEAQAKGERTDRDFAGLTGLTGKQSWRDAEAEAQKMVDDYEAAHDTTALWERINKANKAILEQLYNGGLLGKSTYEKIRDMYDYYIPLRGWEETTSDEVYGYLASGDSIHGGDTLKRAEGRGSKADDPIATMAAMADSAIRQSHRNQMKQRFLNFVLNNPSDLVSASQVWMEYDAAKDEWKAVWCDDVLPTDTAEEAERKIADWETHMEGLRKKDPARYKRGREAADMPYKVVKDNLREHQVLVKRNGQTYVLTINGNPRAAQALNGLTNPDVEQGGIVSNILDGVQKVNRQLSAFYTTRNPDFVVSNFLRDFLYSNMMTWVKEDKRYAIAFHKNYAKETNPYIMRVLFGKWQNGKLDMNNYKERLFQEFMMNGGETGYTAIRDVETHKKNIAREINKHGRDMKSRGLWLWDGLGTQFDLLNRSVENCARFAAFMTSRQMGRSLDRSIHDAKEVSVNFNKKGSGGKMVNATGQTLMGKLGAYAGGGGRLLYVFWNAGVQGMTNIARAAKQNPRKFTAGASVMFTLGCLVPLLAGGSGDDDDANAYYNLPEYVRRSNICFRLGDKQWGVIPLPIEFRAIYGLGELAYGVMSGNERYSDKELASQIGSQISQIMPIDVLEGGGGITPWIPSAFKPFTEAYILNKGWIGLPIYKDTPFNKSDPEWTKAYKSANRQLVSLTRWLNEVSGGDDYKKGLIDINPAKIEYMLNGTFGGAVSFPSKLLKTGETIFGERDFEWKNMPLANCVVKAGDERTAQRKLKNEYYKYNKEYEETKRLIGKYTKEASRGVVEYAEKVAFFEDSPEYLRYVIHDYFKSAIKAYNDAVETETDPETKRQLEEEMYSLMRQSVEATRNPKEFLKESE